MKIRFSNGMIRIRLVESDLQDLREDKAVTLVTALSPVNSLHFSLIPSTNNAIQWKEDSNGHTLELPCALFKGNIEHETLLDHTFDHIHYPTRLVIEVDLPCMH